MDKYNWADPPQHTAFPIARPGIPIILAMGFVTAVFALLGMKIPALVSMGAAFCVCAFFRDPERPIPAVDKAVVSPADGKVIVAETVDDNPFVSGRRLKVSIFMTVFNVHVNRIPYEGKITAVRYRPGTFLPADRARASLANEHNAITIDTDDNRNLCVNQIAGLVARRIVCTVQEGQAVRRGQRFGMICFGSRLDLYLPPDTALNVKIGEKVKAGQSTIGFLQ